MPKKSAFSKKDVASTTDLKTAAVKIPPHSVEAEQSVLGGLMLENAAWDTIADRVAAVDFYRPEHALIFQAISHLVAKSHPFDVLTVAETLKTHQQLEEAGGEIYLFELAKNTPSTANITAYSDIVRERSVLRQLIRTANEIADSAFNPQGRASTELLDDAERRVFQIAERGTHRFEAVKMSHLLAQATQRMDALYNSNEAITGFATGFMDLDEMTSGLQKGDLIIVAGRPSMGKTVFAMNIAENIVMKYNKPVLTFSMEMSGEQIAMRMISSWGRINQHKVRTGKLEKEDWQRVASAVGALSAAPLYVDDSPALSPSEVRARARRLAKEHGDLGLIVIDYLQLMQVPGARENRTLEISEISRNLKALARELNVPVIAISQLNRSLEQRHDRRPVMSDLRESGAIEQDADLIAFIYRDEVYNENSPDKGIAEVIIGKQRNGPTGKVRLTFLGQYTRFENLAVPSYATPPQNYSIAGPREPSTFKTKPYPRAPVVVGNRDDD
jgi:replicative DNA helicase